MLWFFVMLWLRRGGGSDGCAYPRHITSSETESDAEHSKIKSDAEHLPQHGKGKRPNDERAKAGSAQRPAPTERPARRAAAATPPTTQQLTSASGTTLPLHGVRERRGGVLREAGRAP